MKDSGSCSRSSNPSRDSGTRDALKIALEIEKRERAGSFHERFDFDFLTEPELENQMTA